jgi:hypothetical protein
MAFPTDGFTSKPTIVDMHLNDGNESDIFVSADVTVGIEGSELPLSESQIQDIFAAIGGAIEDYLTTLYPGKTLNGPFVNYVGSKVITL